LSRITIFRTGFCTDQNNRQPLYDSVPVLLLSINRFSQYSVSIFQETWKPILALTHFVFIPRIIYTFHISKQEFRSTDMLRSASKTSSC
jgi:hypothetical protein